MHVFNLIHTTLKILNEDHAERSVGIYQPLVQPMRAPKWFRRAFAKLSANSRFVIIGIPNSTAFLLIK